MARPKIGETKVSAENRIIEAFWELLEANRFNTITVRMIISAAKCNRGTFYYHFENIDALVRVAVERELTLSCNVPATLLNLLVKADDATVMALVNSPNIRRISLAMQRGASDLIRRSIKETIVETWRLLLCLKNEPLNPETELIISHAVSGMTSILLSDYEGFILPRKTPRALPLAYIRENSRLTFKHICKMQNVTEEEVLERLSLLETFSRTSIVL